MRFYLSSDDLGNKTYLLEEWKSKNGNKVLVIPNAKDYVDEEKRILKIIEKTKCLKNIGFETEILDLRDYFGRENKLKNDIQKYHCFYVMGGNVFVLRQAMKLSGFDRYLKDIVEQDEDLYIGYSAGICVLAKSLRGYELVDDANVNPYCLDDVIWEGIDLIDFSPIPHFDSPNHPETNLVNKTLEYFKKEKIAYKTLKDGEVIYIKNGQKMF